jgi:hypothetical protein
LGIEEEAIRALRAAEHDKATFCLENDDVAPAVRAFVEDVKRFQGSARDLLDRMKEQRLELPENLSTKGLGRRICGLIPHLAQVFTIAKAIRVRNGCQFVFEAADLRV